MSIGTGQNTSISERRAGYPLHERLKIYSPDSMARKLHDVEKQTKKFILNGVNVLNKSSVDSDTAMSRLQQRRETHKRVERRRRDNLNTLISELSTLVPLSVENGGSKCHRAKVLKYTIDYIQTIQQENSQLRQKLGLFEQ